MYEKKFLPIPDFMLVCYCRISTLGILHVKPAVNITEHSPRFPFPAIGVCMRRTYENLCVFPKISVRTVYEVIIEFNTSLGRFLPLKSLQKTDKQAHSPHELLVRVLC